MLKGVSLLGNSILATLFLPIFTIFFATNDASSQEVMKSEFDRIAVCAGAIKGYAIIDYASGNKEKAKRAVYFATRVQMTAMSRFLNELTKSELKFIDVLDASKNDAITSAYNTGSFTALVYDEILTCYAEMGELSVRIGKLDMYKKSSAVVDKIADTVWSNLVRALKASGY